MKFILRPVCCEIRRLSRTKVFRVFFVLIRTSVQLVLLVWRAASGISRARAVEWLERASLLPLILLPQVLSVPAASAGQHGGPAAHRWAYMPAAAPAACQKILCSALNPAPTHGDVHYLVGPNTAAQALGRPPPRPCPDRPGPVSVPTVVAARAQIERRPAPVPTAVRTRRYRAQCRPLPRPSA